MNTLTDQLVTEQFWWHVARTSGIVAMALTGTAVIWGLLLSTRLLRGRPTPAWLLSMHRFLGAMTVTFTGVHVAGLVADSYVHFGWAEVLVPFASAWKPGAVALGIVGMYLLTAVQLSSMMMRQIPRRWWRWIHQSSFLLFWVAVVHGIQAGTDTGNLIVLGLNGIMVTAVLFLSIVRALASRSATAERPAASRVPAEIG